VEILRGDYPGPLASATAYSGFTLMPDVFFMVELLLPAEIRRSRESCLQKRRIQQDRFLTDRQNLDDFRNVALKISSNYRPDMIAHIAPGRRIVAELSQS